MYFWKTENYYFILLFYFYSQYLQRNNHKHQERPKLIHCFSGGVTSPKLQRAPFLQQKKGVLISSHLPPSSGALHFSILLDSHKTFSEVFLNWNWDMFSVSQVKQ